LHTIWHQIGHVASGQNGNLTNDSIQRQSPYNQLCYTAKEITEVLQKEGVSISLRTVRYYTQIGIIPTLELVGNKRVYTDNHLNYIRAILTLSKTGESLGDIQEKLKQLSPEDIQKIGDQMALLKKIIILSFLSSKKRDSDLRRGRTPYHIKLRQIITHITKKTLSFLCKMERIVFFILTLIVNLDFG
jgi:DNA-binding transcriptional MerR regulator